MQILKHRFFYGWVVVAAAFVVMLVAWGTYYTFGVFFKPLSTDFGWTRAMTAGAFSLYLVIHGILGIVAGGFTDRRGPRLVVGICALFLCAGYLLLSRIGAIWQLYLFYGILIGVGMSGMWIPQVATITRWFVAKRGLVLGIVVAGVGIGQLIFPLLARHIISTASWRMGYFIMGIIALVIIGLASLFLRRDPKQVGLLPYGAEQVRLYYTPCSCSGTCHRYWDIPSGCRWHFLCDWHWRYYW
jgi:MFS family permease